MRVALALGSNIGDGPKQLTTAVEALEKAGLVVKSRSSLYSTKPVGYADQDWFTNAAVVVEDPGTPLRTLALCQQVEADMQRERTIANGPRTIDIDIILWHTEVIDHPDLQVPHPRFRERGFVLSPLAEVAGSWLDPVTGHTVEELLQRYEETAQSSDVTRLKAVWCS